MKKLSRIVLTLVLLSSLFLAACNLFDVVEGVKKVKRLSDVKNMEFSEADGFYIGRKILANFFNSRKPLFDRHLSDYVNGVGQTLAAVSQRPDVWAGYRFIVYRSSGLGAYCMPGGFVLVSTGLLKTCSSEDQLAAVLGHELGHARYRHPLEALKDKMVARAKQDLVAFIGSRSKSGLIKLFSIAAIINWENQLCNYSKTQELEADVYSTWLMRSAGYSPLEMLSILKKIPGGRSKYSRLHPTIRQRLQAVKKEISRYKKMPPRSRKRVAKYKKEVISYLRRKRMDGADFNDKGRIRDRDFKDDKDDDDKDSDDNE